MTDDFIDGVEEKMPGRVLVVKLASFGYPEPDPSADPPVFASEAKLDAWVDEHATDRDIVIVWEYVDYSEEETR